MEALDILLVFSICLWISSMHTSKSNSSGPAKGSNTYWTALIPGAVRVEGATAAFSVSPESMATWPGT